MRGIGTRLGVAERGRGRGDVTGWLSFRFRRLPEAARAKFSLETSVRYEAPWTRAEGRGARGSGAGLRVGGGRNVGQKIAIFGQTRR